VSDYWFFLSYSRRDAIGHLYLKKFYEELAQSVGRLAGLSSEVGIDEIGFFDKSGIELGEVWTEPMIEALQTSRVFLCLYSRGYFNSPNCGKELQIFRSRVDSYLAASPNLTARPPLILPILWDTVHRLPDPLPAVLADVQYTYDEFGAIYAREGLYQIRTLKKYRDSYREFLQAFAGRLVEVAENEQNRIPLIEPMPDYQMTENAFSLSQAGLAQSITMTSLSNLNLGPSMAQFIYLAGCRTDFAGIKEVVGNYGPNGALPIKLGFG
jgi:hypothetical protein